MLPNFVRIREFGIFSGESFAVDEYDSLATDVDVVRLAHPVLEVLILRSQVGHFHIHNRHNTDK